MTIYVDNIEMEATTCSCGITWAAPKQWFDMRRQDHSTFSCPNGCQRYYPQESREDKLKRLLKQKEACCFTAKQELEYTTASLRAYKGVVTKLKKAKAEVNP